MTSPNILYLDLWGSEQEARRAVEAAWRQGSNVLAIARTVPAWLREAAVAFREVDTYDEDVTLAAALDLHSRWPIAGVARWLDRSVVPGALITQRLGLPGPSPETARLVRDKHAVKLRLAQAGIKVPRSAAVNSPADLDAAAERVGFPSIIKPVSASASRCVFAVGDRAELDAAWRQLDHFAQPQFDPIFRLRPGAYVLEERLEGQLLTIDGLVHGGRVWIAGVMQHANTPGTFLDQRHIFPAGISAELEADCRAVTEAVVAAVGLDDCAFQVEGFGSNGRFTFMEMAARTGGDYNTTHLIPEVLGVDFLGDYLRVVQGLPPGSEGPYTPPRNVARGVHYLIVEQQGNFSGLDGLGEASRLPGFEAAIQEIASGSRVVLPPADHFSSRVATIFAAGRDAAEIDRNLDQMLDAVSVRME